jgi:hypothetical protein
MPVALQWTSSDVKSRLLWKLLGINVFAIGVVILVVWPKLVTTDTGGEFSGAPA